MDLGPAGLDMVMDRSPAADVVVPAAHEADGFDAFYRAEHVRSTRRVVLLTGSALAAEDIVHEAMIEVLRRWGTIERPGAYLHRCCVNRALRWLHRQAKEAAVPDPGRRASAPGDPLVEVLDQLAILSERQRTAVVLRYFDDLTEQEIAAAMGIRPGSVGPLLARAKAVLRKEWTR